MKQENITIQDCLYRKKLLGQSAHINDGKVTFHTERLKDRLTNALLITVATITVILFIFAYLVWPVLHLTCGFGKKFAVHAEDNLYGTPFRVESTAYCEQGITKSGRPARRGIAAGKEEWLGMAAVVYEDMDGGPGDLLGIYEILDTGSDERIRNGSCIDLWMPDREACREYGRRPVWIQIVDAKG